MAYSKDIRVRVMGFIESGGSIVEASKRYEIERSTVYEWKRLLKETGIACYETVEQKSV